MSAKYPRLRKDVTGQKPGYTSKIYVALRSEMTTIGAIDPLNVATKDKYVITDDHVFAVATPAKGFVQLYTLPKKNEQASATYGEAGASNRNYNQNFFLPGDGADLQAMVDELLNQDVIVLVEDSNEPDGKIYQLGGSVLEAYITKADFASGNVMDGVKGIAITVESPCRYEYQGTIPLQA